MVISSGLVPLLALLWSPGFMERSLIDISNRLSKWGLHIPSATVEKTTDGDEVHTQPTSIGAFASAQSMSCLPGITKGLGHRNPPREDDSVRPPGAAAAGLALLVGELIDDG